MTDLPFANVVTALRKLRLPAFVEALEHIYEDDPERAAILAEDLVYRSAVGRSFQKRMSRNGSGI